MSSTSSHHHHHHKSSSSKKHSSSSKAAAPPIYYDPSGNHERIFKNPPTRKKLTDADKALLNTHTWSDLSDLKLEHHVVVADARQGALQGVVAYVGKVHFQKGIWVGIQLTGPSLGKGYNDGAVQGKRYFQSVGKRNGVFSHITGIQRRIEESESTKKTPEAQFAQMKYIESLKADREKMLLQEASESKKMFNKDDAIHIKRLKEQSLAELRMSRSEPLEGELLALDGPKPKYIKKDADTTKLCEADFDFMRGLQDSKQNFLLTDPTLPDNPITFASQSFLNMTQYSLNDVVGRNCRFLQGSNTSKRSIAKIRLAIDEGSDVSIRLVNYKKDGTAFWNEFFLTALRDTRGRIKSYVGVLVEISTEVNAMKNEVATFLDSCSPALQTLHTGEEQTYAPPRSKKEKKKKKEKKSKSKSKDALHHYSAPHDQHHQQLQRIRHPDDDDNNRYIQQQQQYHQPQPHHPPHHQRQRQPHPDHHEHRHYHEQQEHLRQKEQQRQHDEQRHYHEQQEQLHRAMANASLQASPRSAFSGSSSIIPQPGGGPIRPVALRPQCVVSNSNHQHMYPQQQQQQQQSGSFYKCLPEREKSNHSRKSHGSSKSRGSSSSSDSRHNWSKLLMSQHSVSESLDDTLDTTEADSSLCYTLSDDDDEDESYGSIGYCY